MSKLLNQQESQKMKAACEAIIAAGKAMDDAPANQFSAQASQWAGEVTQVVNTAKKIMSELDVQAGKNDQGAPNRPDTNRGDEDRQPLVGGKPPSGMNTTYSAAKGDGRQDNQTKGLAQKPIPAKDRQGYVTGGVAERDDSIRGRKHIEEGNTGTHEANKEHTDEGGDRTNISHPIHAGMDTTNTSSDGAGKPDNYFAKQAESHEGDAELLSKQASEPKKYDSENRVATETLEHAAAKAEQERNDPRKATTENTSQDASPVKQTAADMEQQRYQGSGGSIPEGSPDKKPAEGKPDPANEAHAKQQAEDDAKDDAIRAEATRKKAEQGVPDAAKGQPPSKYAAAHGQFPRPRP